MDRDHQIIRKTNAINNCLIKFRQKLNELIAFHPSEDKYSAICELKDLDDKTSTPFFNVNL